MRRVLTDRDVAKIRRERLRGKTIRWLSQRFGVSERTIYSVLAGKKYKRLARPDQIYHDHIIKTLADIERVSKRRKLTKSK